MDLITTQKRFQERQRVDNIRKILALMNRNEITIADLEDFEDIHASITPAEMMQAAKSQKPIKFPKASEVSTNKSSWSL